MGALVKAFGNRGKQSLDVWIRDCLTDSDKTRGDGSTRQILAISLCHQQSNGSLKEIHSVRFGKNKTYEPDRLASLFRGKAEVFSQDLSGVQMFQLSAIYEGEKPGEAASEPEAFLPFRMQGNPEVDINGLGTEAPDERGQRQQMMRWNDTLLAQVFRHQEQLNAATHRIIETQNHTIDHLGRHLAQTQHENAEAFGIVKEIMLEQATKTHENELTRLEYERKTKEREQYLRMLPALVNGLTGREVFPIATQDTAIIESIAENLTEEQIQQVAGVLPPHVTGLIFQRFSAVIDKKLKEKQMRALEERNAANLDPEADAAGEPYAKR